MNTDEVSLNRLSERIIECAFNAANTLGAGFPGKVYENALADELHKALDSVHSARCINYLRATGLRLCLLLIFGSPRLEIRRLVSDP